MVFLPMSFLWSKKWVFPQNELTRQLRNEIYTQPYESINFASHRNSIAKEDNYYPKTMILNVINSLLVNLWTPVLRFSALVKKAEDWVWEMIEMEDKNTDYAGLAPVSNPLNLVCCYIHDGEGSESVRKHRETLHEYLWMKNEGMLCNGTNGVQVWDTAFVTQAVSVAGFAENPKWRPMLTKALEFLDNHQLRENVPNQDKCYRQHRKGAWPFSNKTQGYTVSDCTAEGLRSVLQLQEMYGYPKLVSADRLKDSVDCLLLMQNDTGGFSEYESRRGSPHLELLNAAEVFGGIMISYDHVARLHPLPPCHFSADSTQIIELTKLKPQSTRQSSISSVSKSQMEAGMVIGESALLMRPCLHSKAFLVLEKLIIRASILAGVANSC